MISQVSTRTLSPEDRCSKCSDTSHIEGFRCPASRFQCKHWHKFGHFSRLCYRKQESEYKKNTRKPRAHQLMVGRASAVCDQSDASYSSSEDSFVCKCKSSLHKQRPKCKTTASSYKYRIQIESLQKENQVSQGQDRHMFKC